MGRSRILLIRHARPEMVEGVPARAWRLSDAGREAARALARDIDVGTARVVYSSTEPKALETAQIVADLAGLSVVPDERLGEHRRGTVEAIADDLSFRKRVEGVLRDPDSDTFGEETGAQAVRRFTAAMTEIVDEEMGRDVIVVSHGTVIALFTERDVEKRVALWRNLGMPDAISLMTR